MLASLMRLKQRFVRGKAGSSLRRSPDLSALALRLARLELAHFRFTSIAPVGPVEFALAFGQRNGPALRFDATAVAAALEAGVSDQMGPIVTFSHRSTFMSSLVALLVAFSCDDWPIHCTSQPLVTLPSPLTMVWRRNSILVKKEPKQIARVYRNFSQ